MSMTTHALFISSEDRMDNIKVNIIKTRQAFQTSKENTAEELLEPKKKHSGSLLGKHSFIFWMLFILLVILAIGNLVITLVIFCVLHLGKGMHDLEVISEPSTIKFLNAIHLDNIIKRDGRIEGYGDTPMEIEVPNSSFLVNLLKNDKPSTKMKFNNNGIAFTGVENMDIIDPHTREKIFETEFTRLNIAKSTKRLISTSVATNKIISPVDRNLNIESNGKIQIQGTEGLYIQSSDIFWSADQDVIIHSFNGTISLNGKDGVSIDTQTIPLITDDVKTKHDAGSVLAYKLCICMPQGKLFRVPVLKGHNPKGICTHIKMDSNNNPCI
ncbi:uncharacterized protein LOC113373585 [Ctenocephalides felis]|uniref:uncharacterized protein LOC113373585 n=1 Tax=Ctenocephalides felis TaxID=7515 RepID=UPI000E6E220A|nr:uncharacterized protein LOC113373585 [Ctenocephalides felis]